MNSAFDELMSKLPGVSGARRLGQALWMKIDAPLRQEELLWCRGLLGPNGEQILWQALLQKQVVDGSGGLVNAYALADFLSQLYFGKTTQPDRPRVVWTLPAELAHLADPSGYSKAATTLVREAQHSVLVVSPYLEARGVGLLLDAIVSALARGVQVTLITHDAENASSRSSLAVKELRKESASLPGGLEVLTATDNSTLLHSKLIVADGARGLLGSANVTEPGFAKNLESGVLLYREECAEIGRVISALKQSGLVSRVFSTARE